MRSLSPAKIPTALRFAAPLAVVAVLAAACSSSSTPSSSGTSTAAPGGSAVTIMTHSGPDGTYLTDSAGRTLYLWTADKGSTSNCSGGCAAVWAPVTSSATPTAGTGVNGSDLGLSKRSDGSEQVTYNGHPLYYYGGDGSAGQMTGQGSTGFGAAWWIVSPSGYAITGSGSGAGSPSSPSGGGSPTNSGGGGSWA